MRNNYIEILSNKIEIPILQRDYAQGRTDTKTNKIRKDFLDALFGIICQKQSKDAGAEIELDFIYGFSEQVGASQTAFIPIDGQQRLTTLWLLYWFVSVKESVSAKEKVFLSNFLYETRHSTTQFCKKLVHSSTEYSGPCISTEIKNQPWYFETWDYDPSIRAMLIVLDDIQNRYADMNLTSVWNSIANSSCPFYFYKLDMNKVGLTDDLYIKMNSRGKALTEFEYFKAGFSEQISDSKQKERFEKSIDGKWIDAVWHIVFESDKATKEDDIALTVDNSFLNLFNFVTSVISYKKESKTNGASRYTDTVNSAELLNEIYSETGNFNFLFDTLDAVCNQQEKAPSFWEDTFYYDKNNFGPDQTRLFFQHKQTNLLKRCLFGESRSLPFPEQLLFLACLTHLKSQNKDFTGRIRTIRNLVVNSDNELRESSMGFSMDEVENYIANGDLSVLKTFKTDQIDEEKRKHTFLLQSRTETAILRQLEDSDILRACISLIPADGKFGNRAKKFLEIFDEDEMINDFNTKCNLLMCFGDYSQDDYALTNLMSGTRTIIRRCLTTPGYNKSQFINKTQAVILACLDYFIDQPGVSVPQKIDGVLKDYASNPKDWRYYFMKYPSFRERCLYGYYEWRDDHYCFWKMGKMRFSGYHWDPFLYEISKSVNAKQLTLGNFGIYDKLTLLVGTRKILISSLANGFLFEDELAHVFNHPLNDLIAGVGINESGKLLISQNSDGIDLEDRVEVIIKALKVILSD